MNEFYWAVFFVVVIVLPLSLFKKLGALRFTSFASLVSLMYIIIVVAIEFFLKNAENVWEMFEEAEPFNCDFTRFSLAMPLFYFSYICHPNVLEIYDELKNKNQQRMCKVMFSAMAVCFVSYSIVGIFGYLTFYKQYPQYQHFPDNILLADYGEFVI